MKRDTRAAKQILQTLVIDRIICKVMDFHWKNGLMNVCDSISEEDRLRGLVEIRSYIEKNIEDYNLIQEKQ